MLRVSGYVCVCVGVHSLNWITRCVCVCVCVHVSTNVLAGEPREREKEENPCRKGMLGKESSEAKNVTMVQNEPRRF